MNAPAMRQRASAAELEAHHGRCLLLADYVRSWRLGARMSSIQAARGIGGISHSWIDAAERTMFDPAAVPPEILMRLHRRVGGEAPAFLLPYLTAPQGAGAASAAGTPDGAGDDEFPVRQSPAPEGPDGPARRTDDDADEPAFPHVMLRAEFGETMIETVFGCGSHKIFTADEALLFAERLLAAVREARATV
jgi:hypothetical protein